jgi:transcriptional regulator with XRE-family HTH domain
VRTDYGVQPSRSILLQQARTVAGVARLLQVSPQHLKNALSGLTPPRPEVRERLPEILGVPLEQLFTQSALTRQFGTCRPRGKDLGQ